MNVPTYKCDWCYHTFTSYEASFTVPIDGVVFDKSFAVQCICKDKRIHKKTNPKSYDGDRIITCPNCKNIHIHEHK